jgi:hypothetical protein
MLLVPPGFASLYVENHPLKINPAAGNQVPQPFALVLVDAGAFLRVS